MSQKVGIVGAGILGLTLALRLVNRGFSVTIFDSANEIGGLASAWQIGDFIWDKHYHVTLFSDTYTRKIISEIGLDDEFDWVETKTGFYAEGRLFSVSNVVEFLQFPVIGFLDKIRLAATILYASHIAEGNKLEEVSVEEWLRKLSGQRNFERLWKPLLRAKLGDAYQQTNAAFIWATIRRMYAARRSGLKKEMFGYVKGGYATILQKFSEVLESKGVCFRLGNEVKKIEKSGEKVVLDETDTFDYAILTCPSDIAAKMLPQASEQEKRRLEAIKYQGIICASLLVRKSLSPYYITNITDEVPFTGIIEMTALVDKSHFGGNALVYLPKYVPSDDELFEAPDDEIKRNFLSALKKMYSHFSEQEVLAFRVSRVRRVFPITTLNYSKNLPPMQTSLKRVFVVNSSHIRYATLNVNETIQLAESFCRRYFQNETGSNA
ncbi:MAG: NAD(P)/FAD-dependent oxidoreductase [Pyrinomonadaceae bacterium]|nr:NAD(P)/FAD-dependent oxidoreductase [Pyrinomonadaceae bacterium]MCX7638994.1 NAD(P)/FAD-dependent oxidoreductase [Pyrinomonadaceae bacterium]MDW8303786.1 NAD(P)/FAD-dependent oxidoreductase [Acidobacteriota bacterium]